MRRTSPVSDSSVPGTASGRSQCLPAQVSQRRLRLQTLAWLAGALIATASAPVAARSSGFSAFGSPRCEVAPPKPAPKRYVVAAVGDSLTDTRVGGGRYLNYLSQRCPESRFDAYGVGGQRTEHMRWRFLHDVFGVGAARKPPAYTHVIVLGGINDLSAGSLSDTRTGRIRDNLRYMYREAHERGLEVVAVEVPPWGLLRGVRDARVQATLDLNSWIASRPGHGEAEYAVDLGPVLRCDERPGVAPGDLCPSYRRFPTDRIHWNAAGHKRVAEVLYQSVFSDCR
ncbi:MAG: SGNH/GDSL hydrolase family protein [Polyangiaceae bacterium]